MPIEESSSAIDMTKRGSDTPVPAQPDRGIRFWMAMVCIMLSTFLAALDTTSVATALPTIVEALHGEQFVWVGSAYTLASVATIPLSGNLANLFGRRSVLLVSLIIFAVGSAVSGAAQSLSMLIAGRTVQGAGSGGIIALTEIILADLVPLRERGAYQGMIGLVWSLASCIGPPVGGAFASRKDWTWRGLFCKVHSDIPFQNLKIPEQSLAQKLRRIDWIYVWLNNNRSGNAIITAATTSTLIGLTWGGVQFPWSSARVLVPLILGIFGIFVWILYESLVAKEPFLTIRLFSNRTTVSGFLVYLPVYFQACKGDSPIRSGVDLLPYSFSIAPFAIVAGAAASATKKYRVQNIVAWGFIMVGLGLQSTLHVTSATRNWVGFEIIAGIGFGLLFTATTFPILSPLPVTDNGTALALFIFIRSFFQVCLSRQPLPFFLILWMELIQAWGITIGATVLQNQLKSRLPQQFLESLATGIDLAYSSITQIASLPADLKLTVQNAFAESLKILWFVLLGISAIGLLGSLLMKEIELHDEKDERWGMKEEGNSEQPINGEKA
ncbi:hypothetical protein Clacol_003143 [Clathrus columnatus]|uniref:Major facilitator superfamily (MFS) profile domain-containing protein n=1 Tax=Clathrus columnatus TaxID=1419009 RepID=A0AAV5A8E3_9AGAM|nr:hypothetical protein Clacol_003143 [Clathrus columnatus]